MIPQGTRFIGFSPKVDLSERKTANSNSETEPYTLDDIKGYKVFTALLTQNGGDSPVSSNYTNLEPLTIGRSYYIFENNTLQNGGTDFTNVGAANNEVGTWFIATGTTPIWGASSGDVTANEGAPVATVLENTIGNIWFTYNDIGIYFCNSDGLFTANKTVNTLHQTGNISDYGDGIYYAYMVNTSINYQTITILDSSLSNLDTLLSDKLIEIRVYN